MFYSHQLLARKAPLGQIWMAATMHAKMNRKKLNKLNLITICEQILNPSVPMALRLSGILMGGVVIVYERKVKLLYDDVTRLLVEINEAWKVKAAPDPTVLPKGKSQAKKEAVTLPENPVELEEDVGDMEQSLNFSGATTTMGFQQTSYFAMRLDTIDEPYLDNDPGQEDESHQLHQADADNIKLFDRFDSYQGKTDTAYNRFERFDTDGDEETHMNFSSGGHMDIPTSLVPSPPPQEDDHGGQRFETDKNQEQDNHISKQYNECKEPREERQRQGGPVKRKTRRQPNAALDYHQTIIPGHVYQTWLQNSSDIISGRGSRKKARRDIMSTMKISSLMELPPMVLIDESLRTGNGDIYYPAPLLQLWLRSSQPYYDSPSEKTSPPLPPEPSLSSPPQRVHNQDGGGYVFDDFRGAAGSEFLDRPIEKLRVERNDGMPSEIFLGELRANLSNGIRITETNMVTPGNSVDEMRSIPSSGSEHGFPSRPDANSGRSNKKRPFYSSSIHSGSGLEPVAEESFLHIPDPNLKLSRLSENELLAETGPTQTQHPIINQPLDKITESIKTQMKAHFEMPGAPQAESLNNLAIGMNRKGAALLFYQACVLATRGFLRVEQKEPYGDILISKGAKM